MVTYFNAYQKHNETINISIHDKRFVTLGSENSNFNIQHYEKESLVYTKNGQIKN